MNNDTHKLHDTVPGELLATLNQQDRDRLIHAVHDFFDEAGIGEPVAVLTDLLNYWLTNREGVGKATRESINDTVRQVSSFQRFLATIYELSVKIAERQKKVENISQVQ